VTEWSTATVVENRAESADGIVRTLVLSVDEDNVPFLDGRKRKHVQDGPRWCDNYTTPGQKVHLKIGDATEAGQERILPLSSSPYASHSASADLSATIIEVLVEHGASDMDEQLANLAPGSLVQVSNIRGPGFSSLINPDHSLQRSLEDGRGLLVIAQGTNGIGAVRACLEWTPVQAHATEHPVTLVYLSKNAGSSAYLKDWDSWRAAGIKVKPVHYSEDDSNGTEISNEDALDKLAIALYNEGGLQGIIGCAPEDCTVLMAGLPGSVATALGKRIIADGVQRNWLWLV